MVQTESDIYLCINTLHGQYQAISFSSNAIGHDPYLLLVVVIWIS
uniref:Uncharacterized protein n=1 Tax=Heterorhabditis bacteriophora TaxID=37862 RepID=A0A1I7WBS4_HETBA